MYSGSPDEARVSGCGNGVPTGRERKSAGPSLIWSENIQELTPHHDLPFPSIGIQPTAYFQKKLLILARLRKVY